MRAITLRRSDSAKNLHRYYRLDVQPDLFGAWCFVREWGRIGRAGQMRIVPTLPPTRPKPRLKSSAV
jgi:predicted DNA-binding WGR domain protein